MMRSSHVTGGRESAGRETLLVTQLAVAISILSFMIYLRQDSLLLYGDAVAHINIARRVFDSRTPGLLQLGTVWLPLPHLLTIPFLLSKRLWQTGIGGSVPSMLAYVLGVSGIFRLVRNALSFRSPVDTAARMASWLAASIYAANPNLLYLQSTAMTESLYLALFIWAVAHFTEFVREENRREGRRPMESSSALLKCGLCIFGACLTRYDGWFLAVIMCAAAFKVLRNSEGRDGSANLLKFVLIAAAAPLLWLGYNAIVYRNPLEFANGPYSARAIEKRNATPGNPSHPGAHSPMVAFTFFVKSAEMNVASQTAVQRLWLVLAFLGTAMAMIFDARLWPLLLLWVPLPFYVLSISYGGVPIFLPVWWPHSYYNLRYGLELLPAFAVFVGLFANFAVGLTSGRSLKSALSVALLLFVAVSYLFIWRERPACFTEAMVNSKNRIALEKALAENLRKLPSDSTLLMYLGDHAGAAQAAGIRLRSVINEGNHRPWKKPVDPQGLWERALASPSQYADYVIASDSDQADVAVQKAGLSPIVVIHAAGEPKTTIYWTHRQPH